MNKLVALFLYPISLIYGCITFIRNKLFDLNILKSTEFNFPVISVGNLSVGGVGKTPHVEYLIRLLNDFKLATLSRGYKRQSKGFFLALDNSTVYDIGDEPLQYKSKFENLIVAVDENRVRGIKLLKKSAPDVKVIILDDAFQHRAVNPGINILVTDYSKLYIDDIILPSGRLREFAIGSSRADVIIVSKTPDVLSPIEIRRIKLDLNPKPYQEIFFSYTKYGTITPFTNKAKEFVIDKLKNFTVLLITGIAKPLPLYLYIKDYFNDVEHIKFPDHYNFTSNDITSIKSAYHDLYGNNKIIITTEKDFMRLSLPEIKNQLEEFPCFFIPIEVYFHGKDKEEFDNKILKYVRANTRS